MKQIEGVHVEPELKIVYFYFANIAVFCKLLTRSLEKEVQYLEKADPAFDSKPVFITCKDVILKMKVGRSPRNISSSTQVAFPYNS